MVFYNWVIALRLRPRDQTKSILREVALEVLQTGGAIRKLSNEGVVRTYKGFRDPAGARHHNVRFVNLQVDISDTEGQKLAKRLKDHPDVLRNVHYLGESSFAARVNPSSMRLDSFTRMEEEMAWPPQVTSDAYEQIDMNWKEFSRARWSNYLRS
jgi:hypothetical protein